MKFTSLAALMFCLFACAPESASRPAPTPSSSAPAANSFKTDATDCERQAAVAGAGGKSAAFESCMRARGHTPGR